MELYVVHCGNDIDGVYSTLELAEAAADSWYDPPTPYLIQVADGIWEVPGSDDDDNVVIVRVDLDVSLLEP